MAYLHLKESGAEGGPLEDELQEGQLGLLLGLSCMLVEVGNNRLQKEVGQDRPLAALLPPFLSTSCLHHQGQAEDRESQRTTGIPAFYPG